MRINYDVEKLSNCPSPEIGNQTKLDAKYPMLLLAEILRKQFNYCADTFDVVDSTNTFSVRQTKVSKYFQFFLNLTSQIVNRFEKRSEIIIEVDQ